MAKGKGPAHEYGSNKQLAGIKWSQIEKTSTHKLWVGAPKLKDVPIGKAMGIDPGVNLGVAELVTDLLGRVHIRANFVKLHKGRHDSEFAYPQQAVVLFTGGDYKFSALDKRVAIEGPAHLKMHWQAQLGAIRGALHAGARLTHAKTISEVPPLTARKDVLGYAKFTGADIWPSIDSNAADAVVLALWAAGYRWKETI
jgi:hypothetical protein